MYNLFVSSNPHAWDGEPWKIELSRCVREYTDTEITERYGALDAPAIAELKRLPSLFTYEAAREYGFRVNAVPPGPVDTAMAKAAHTPAIRADYHDHIPLNRYGLETELANAICFLCGDQAGYITGQVLAVDGGFDAAGVGLPTLRRERRNT
jgi:NAD(P)-dependent dehydrogenase (short-subunit alcohol dehydrogenase family)